MRVLQLEVSEQGKAITIPHGVCHMGVYHMGFVTWECHIRGGT